MKPPQGMSVQPLSLSQGPGALAEKHHLDEVRGIVFRGKGDGWVLNEWPNRHLSGSVTQWRGYDTVTGRKHRREFLPVDSALLEVGELYNWIAEEAGRIATGQVTETGEVTLSELDELSYRRIQLGHWLTLTEVEKEDIRSYFGSVAEVRAHAINPFNVFAGARAARMQQLKDRTGRDNPGAILAMSRPLEHYLLARYQQVVGEIRSANDGRDIRLQTEWIFQESRRLARANEVLDSLITRQGDRDLVDLMVIARGLRFRVQPFNQLQYNLRKTGNSIEDVSTLETTQAGLRFHRLYNYLMQPFRQLTALTLEKAAEPTTDNEAIMAGIGERHIALQLVEAGGAYDRLIKRLLPLVEQTLAGLHRLDPGSAIQEAKQFKWLLTYHCFPENDPEMEVWYRYQL